jgi:hypothetical protein
MTTDTLGTHKERRAARGAADWLCLAAAPTFASMALITGVFDGGSQDMFCAAHHVSSAGGMVWMYLLMSAFHSTPWLKLISNRQRPSGVRGTATLQQTGA